MAEISSGYGQSFPLSDYYKEHVLDAITIKRSAKWWTALLVIEDPRTQTPFIAIYRWELRAGQWKKRSSIPWKTKESLEQFKDALSRLENHLS